MASFFDLFRPRMVTAEQALVGRTSPIPTAARHAVFDRPLGDEPPGCRVLFVGMGCFWGAERKMWKLGGVRMSAVGYQGGFTPNPTYEEVCSGRTGHTEAVKVVYDPAQVTDEQVLAAFWEGHDPTQGNRQGNDVGTQYRSAVYWTAPEQEAAVHRTRDAYAAALAAAGHPRSITTELGPAGPFYFAEAYHQQYLHKNPGGYCGLGGTGVSCPVGLGA